MYLALIQRRPTLQTGWIVWGVRNGKVSYWNGYTMYQPGPYEPAVPSVAVLFPSQIAANAVRSLVSIRAYNPQTQRVTVTR